MKILPPLPNKPNLDFLRREAKALRSKHRLHDESICLTIGHFDTSLHGLNNIEILSRRFSILDAQRVTARRYGFSSWNRIKMFVEQSATTTYVDKDLRQKLLSTQKKIDLIVEDAKAKRLKKPYRKIELEFSQKSAELLEPIFDEHNWPGPELVGRDGVEACFYIVACSVSAGDLNRRAVVLMKDALATGAAYGHHYAMISDRCLALGHKPTVYGISPGFDEQGRLLFSKNVVDPENLDRRRALVGYQAFEYHQKEYIKEAEEKGWDLYPDPTEHAEYTDKLAKQGGYLGNEAPI